MIAKRTAWRNKLIDLISIGTSQWDEQLRLDSLERRYVDHVESERAWLAEHVLWGLSTECDRHTTARLRQRDAIRAKPSAVGPIV